MLVSGVWRLWLTPRRKSSLAASSSSSWLFWASTRANSWAFRVATAISLADAAGIDRQDAAVDHLEGGPRVGGGPAGEELGAVAGRGALDRGEDPAKLAIPPFEDGRQAIVAVGEAGKLILTRN